MKDKEVWNYIGERKQRLQAAMLRTEERCYHLEVKLGTAESTVKTLMSYNLKTKRLSRDLCPALNRTGLSCPLASIKTGPVFLIRLYWLCAFDFLFLLSAATSLFVQF